MPPVKVALVVYPLGSAHQPLTSDLVAGCGEWVARSSGPRQIRVDGRIDGRCRSFYLRAFCGRVRQDDDGVPADAIRAAEALSLGAGAHRAALGLEAARRAGRLAGAVEVRVDRFACTADEAREVLAGLEGRA